MSRGRAPWIRRAMAAVLMTRLRRSKHKKTHR
jgi:hypothetical protein